MSGVTPGALSIGYTGKLPAYGDFVRQNVSSPAARAFEAWQSEGLLQFPSTVGNGWETAFDSAPGFSFVFSGPERGIFAVGSSFPSRDKSGRRYPFSVFSSVQLADESRHFLLPLAAAGFLDAAKQIWDGDWPAAVDAVFARKMAPLSGNQPQLSPELERHFENRLAEVTVKDFFGSLFGEFEAAEKYLVMDNLFKTLIPFRGRDTGRISFALRFPLGGASVETQRLQAGFWLLACQRALSVPFAPPGAFWGRDGLRVLFRAPEAKFFPLILTSSMDSNSIWNLAELGKEKLVKEKLPPALVKVLDAPGEPLHSLLNVKFWEKNYLG